jgi:hypothetical protein
MESPDVSTPIFPPHPYRPFGISYELWTIKWWKWLMSVPKTINPVFDESGVNCHINQNDPNVWFIAGTFGGFAERQCTIPLGKSIFFPIINIEASFNDTEVSSELELVSFTKTHIDDINVNGIQVKVDNMVIDKLDRYRISTPVFDLNFLEDNILNAKVGLTKAASDGYWVFLRPLCSGFHTLFFSGSCLSGKIRIGAKYIFDIN